MKYLSLIIGSAGLIVALASFAWSWWLNRRTIKPTFKWVRSVNDKSVKLTISIINLSPRTTVITDFILKSGTKVISDNGYDYVAAESKEQEKLRAEEDKKRDEQYLFNLGRLTSQAMPVVQPLIQLYPYSPRTDSQNFYEPTALFGNNSIHFTYWLDAENLPDQLVIKSSSFVNHLRKQISFEIPTISNQVDKRSNV